MAFVAAWLILLTLAAIATGLAAWAAHERISSVQCNLDNTREWVKEVQDSLEPCGEDEDRVLDRLAQVITKRNTAKEIREKVMAAAEMATKE